MTKPHTPNDHRSIVKNPNNPAHGHDGRNRGTQGSQPTKPPPTKPPPTPPQK